MFILVTAAMAAPECSELGQAAFQSLLLDTQAAVDRADRGLHRTFVKELENRVPCLTFVPSQREWAEFLVALALLEFGDGGDWQTPLTAALYLRPGVDLGVGEAHPIARFEPGAPPEPSGAPVPEGVALYVDGELADRLPPPTGMHLVQKEEDGYWASILLVDEALSEQWLTTPIERSVDWSWQGSAGLAVGSGYLLQRPEQVSEPAFIPRDNRLEFLPGVYLRALGQRKQLGLSVDMGMASPDLSRAGAAYAEGAVSWHLASVWLGAGAGVTGGTVIEGVPSTGSEPEWEEREVALPYALLDLRAQRPTARSLELGLSLGGGPSVQRVHAFGGVQLEVFETPLRLGLAAVAQRGAFVQQDFPDRGSTSWQGRIGVELGWSWASSGRP